MFQRLCNVMQMSTLITKSSERCPPNPVLNCPRLLHGEPSWKPVIHFCCLLPGSVWQLDAASADNIYATLRSNLQTEFYVSAS